MINKFKKVINSILSKIGNNIKINLIIYLLIYVVVLAILACYGMFIWMSFISFSIAAIYLVSKRIIRADMYKPLTGLKSHIHPVYKSIHKHEDLCIKNIVKKETSDSFSLCSSGDSELALIFLNKNSILEFWKKDVRNDMGYLSFYIKWMEDYVSKITDHKIQDCIESAGWLIAYEEHKFEPCSEEAYKYIYENQKDSNFREKILIKLEEFKNAKNNKHKYSSGNQNIDYYYNRAVDNIHIFNYIKKAIDKYNGNLTELNKLELLTTLYI